MSKHLSHVIHFTKRIASRTSFMIQNSKFSTTPSRGFTLIELLVVIAIIGILSSVVLASLSSARKKGRDARRLADLKQVQLALELYADANGGKYPTGATMPTASLAPTYISTVPTDPSDQTAYGYAATTTGCDNSATNCVGYFLGATLETTGQTGALLGDIDSSAAMTIHGAAANCSTNAGGATEAIYCISN